MSAPEGPTLDDAAGGSGLAMTRRAALGIVPAAMIAGQAVSRPVPRPESNEAEADAETVFEAGIFEEGVFT
jgi:hypothetical protein